MVRFTTKKIEALTLGESLKKIREERRLSLNEISKATQIQIKYLECLEQGNFKKLPADVYVRGFLRSYAIFMGMDEKSLIKQYEREKGIQKNIKKYEDDTQPKDPIKISNFVITPKVMSAVGIFGLVFLGFFYLYREVNQFISTPQLVLLKPSDGATIEGKNVQIVGIAEKDSLVYVNDQAVLVNEKGEFSEPISLKSGINNIEVKVRNKFEKETVKSLLINSVQAEQEFSLDNIGQDAAGQSEKRVVMEVSVTAPTWLSIEADGNLVYSGTLAADETKKIEASEKILLSSAKGNQTLIKLNGTELGPLDSEALPVKDAEFDVNGRVEKIAPAVTQTEEETAKDSEKKKKK